MIIVTHDGHAISTMPMECKIFTIFVNLWRATLLRCHNSCETNCSHLSNVQPFFHCFVRLHHFMVTKTRASSVEFFILFLLLCCTLFVTCSNLWYLHLSYLPRFSSSFYFSSKWFFFQEDSVSVYLHYMRFFKFMSDFNGFSSDLRFFVGWRHSINFYDGKLQFQKFFLNNWSKSWIFYSQLRIVNSKTRRRWRRRWLRKNRQCVR